MERWATVRRFAKTREPSAATILEILQDATKETAVLFLTTRQMSRNSHIPNYDYPPRRIGPILKAKNDVNDTHKRKSKNILVYMFSYLNQAHDGLEEADTEARMLCVLYKNTLFVTNDWFDCRVLKFDSHYYLELLYCDDHDGNLDENYDNVLCPQVLPFRWKGVAVLAPTTQRHDFSLWMTRRRASKAACVSYGRRLHPSSFIL